MQLEEQVCTLEQAKRLKELGVDPRPAAFYFFQAFINGKEYMKLVPYWNDHYFEREENESVIRALVGESKNEVYAAFTVGELGMLLPQGATTHNLYDGKWIWNWPQITTKCATLFDTEAEARAALLIYLLEWEKITADEVNVRLSS